MNTQQILAAVAVRSAKMTKVPGAKTKIATSSAVKLKGGGAIYFEEGSVNISFDGVDGYDELENCLNIFFAVPAKHQLSRALESKTPEIMRDLLKQVLKNLPGKVSDLKLFTPAFAKTITAFMTVVQTGINACQDRI